MHKSRIVLLLLCVVFLAAAITFFVLWRSSAAEVADLNAEVADFDRAQKRAVDEVHDIVYPSKRMTLQAFPGVKYCGRYGSETAERELYIGFGGTVGESRRDYKSMVSSWGVWDMGSIHIDRDTLPQEFSQLSMPRITEYVLTGIAKQVLKADSRWVAHPPFVLLTGGGNVLFVCDTGFMTLTLVPIDGKPGQFALMESYGFVSCPIWDGHELSSYYDKNVFHMKLREELDNE